MSGHNKWSQIKHQKGAEDAKKSKLYSMMGRLVTIQARLAGGDMSGPALRAAIEKARKANVTSEVIDRAVKRGTGVGEAALEEVLYEAYGPGGVALVIEGITDSRNRTSNEIKHLISEHGAKWANPGSVLWAFEKKDSVWVSKPYSEMELLATDTAKLYKLMEVIDDHEDVQEVYANNKEA